jgi:hypothetical protein
MKIYVTPFDRVTKKCTAPSTEIPVGDFLAAEAMMGSAPRIRTKNTMIFNQPNGQALCVSWIRFSV